MRRFSVVLVLLVAGSLFGEVRYRVVALVPADPYIANGGAMGINQFGDATGSFYNSNYTRAHGFEYTDGGGFVDLGYGAVGLMYLTGINNDGQICGYGRADETGRMHVFRYTEAVGFVDLSVPGWRSAEATGINNSGQVTGAYEMNNGSERAFLYTDGKGMEDLGVLGGQNSVGRGINDLGWVTGTSYDRAFIYTEETGMVDIGPGSGWAINELGAVAGEISYQPVLYVDGRVEFLGGTGSARGINNHKVVVGGSEWGSPLHAFVWSRAEGMQDLNDVIDSASGWYLITATGINDAGQIVGGGMSPDRPWATTGCRLDPIPPRLQIALDGTNVVVSWSPRWPGLLLETADLLSPSSWQAVVGGTNSPVVLPASGRGQLFRLGRYDSFDPTLSVSVSGTDVMVSWGPPWPDCVLESSGSLSPAVWAAVQGVTNSPVTLPMTNAACYFRLRK